MLSKPFRKRFITQAPTLRASDNHSQLVEISIIPIERPNIAKETKEEGELSKSVTQISLLHIYYVLETRTCVLWN